MENRVILTANEGYVYTNGINYGLVIYLANGENPNDYWQITMEEYIKIEEALV